MGELTEEEARALELQLRMNIMEATHSIVVAILTTIEDHDGPIGKAARMFAVRMKALVVDGIEDYDGYLLWTKCQDAIARAFPDSPQAHTRAALEAQAAEAEKKAAALSRERAMERLGLSS